MKTRNAEELLKKHKLRFTEGRVTILEQFLQHSWALSHGDLENILPASFDRVTIYRTLKSFVENGILHKVTDPEGFARYAVCSTDCSTDSHHHDHVHFKCEKCGNTTCLDSVEIPSLVLPKGYFSKEASLLVQGICPNCP